MKNLASYIIENMKTSESWNEKIYQNNDNTVTIFVDDNKLDVTELFNSNLNKKGQFVRSEFNEVFAPMQNEMIEKELDNL
jgi:hypothetical protein